MLHGRILAQSFLLTSVDSRTRYLWLINCPLLAPVMPYALVYCQLENVEYAFRFLQFRTDKPYALSLDL